MKRAFSSIDRTDYDALYAYLSHLEKDDGSEIRLLCEEFYTLCNNKTDEPVENRRAIYRIEREENVASLKVLLDEIETKEEKALIEKEMERRLAMLEEQRKRQAEARRAFQERLKPTLRRVTSQPLSVELDQSAEVEIPTTIDMQSPS